MRRNPGPEIIMSSPASPKERSSLSLFMLHGACFLLVVVYVNMFQFWAWLSRELGPGILVRILPIVVTLAVLGIIVIRFVRRVNRGYRIRYVFLGLGIIFAFLALAIPNPDIPIKRVHVAEYIILAFLVRYVLSQRLDGLPLTLFTILVTILYGVHDEMLQGLHSMRYFGWRDIIVNAVAGMSGGMLGHGLMVFEREKQVGAGEGQGRAAFAQYAWLVLLSGVLIWQVSYLYLHRTGIALYAAVGPLLVFGLISAVWYRSIFCGFSGSYGLRVMFWQAAGLVLYPLAARYLGIEFL